MLHCRRHRKTTASRARIGAAHQSQPRIQGDFEMTDSVASRVTRIVSGSVHALLDAVENAAPEAMMSQAIREVEQVTDEVRAELGKAEAAKHLVTAQINKLNTDNEQLAAQIESALAQGREELVRAGL